MNTPRTEFANALKAVATERGLDVSVILDTIKQAIVAAYRRDARERGEEIPEEQEFEVTLDSSSGEAKIATEGKDVTPPGFGRIAAQTAKQVIHQKIREAEKTTILGEYEDKIGTLVGGLVLRFEGPNVRVDLGKTEALMPVEERVANERLSLNQRLQFLLKEIVETPRGREMILSRTDTEFVKKLFAREVPEIAAGNVEIKLIAREPGVRTKIAVFSAQNGIDPVGSCVGQKGVRVQAVTRELLDERIDVIGFSEDAKELIASALSPAENVEVELNAKAGLAIAKVAPDQLSLAIGKDGQNARLAGKLTNWKIEVVSTEPEGEEVVEEAEKLKEEIVSEAKEELNDKKVITDDTDTKEK